MSVWGRVIDERKRVVVPLVVFFVANIAVLALGVLPLQRSVAGQREKQLAVQQQLVAAIATVRQAGSVRDRTEDAEAGLRTFYADVLPQGHDDAVQVSNFWMT